MSTRALLIAATALAGGVPIQSAYALAPWAMDDAMTFADPQGPSPTATLAPHDFANTDPQSFESDPVVADARAHLQCVPFARREAGLEIYGNANTWWAQAKGRYLRVHDPRQGAVAVLHGYSRANRGHVAVVRQVVSDRIIIVDHANWLNGGEITRDVPVRDVSAAGDWSRVQVWNVTGRHWGGRVYRVQGFIVNTPAEAAAS